MNNLNPEITGKRIEELRKSKGLSQRELSRKTGIAQSAISDFEAGMRVPSSKSLDKLVVFFQMPVSEFFIPSSDPTLAEQRYLRESIVETIHKMDLEELRFLKLVLERFAP